MVMMWAGLLGGCQGSDDETETTAVETDAYDETATETETETDSAVEDSTYYDASYDTETESDTEDTYNFDILRRILQDIGKMCDL